MGLVDREAFGKDIVCLDSGQSSDFYRCLHDIVDSCPSRSLSTTYVFYVKEGQRCASDILNNSLNIQNTSADFCGFLASLGEGVEVTSHDSWTGHWSTAFSNERKPVEESPAVDHYTLDGITHALWWADAECELVFILPTERTIKVFKQNIASSAASCKSGSSKATSAASISSDDTKADTLTSADVLLYSGRKKAVDGSMTGSERDGVYSYGGGGSNMGNTQPSRRSTELRIMLAWLERAEDMMHFPIDDLLTTCDDGDEKAPWLTNPSYLVIFIYQVETGLVNIRTKGSTNRFGEAGPLCDLMSVSLASLPSFIRLTVSNIVRRNVAEIENYQFTHTKRKQSIMDFGRKFMANLTYEDFLQRLILL
ncbi:hypothetical protein DICVIV_11286 [Dictyocaulus viviparus]|uniref:Rap-GAP domain-containing protein n=1 Tax=Dictyocaulus viviparus TaxID=29172 RepID=A0A0D8XK85_DICVI|nr:hypothetical protein DICVIV_11286 [Dictyocaulus viviparus]